MTRTQRALLTLALLLAAALPAAAALLVPAGLPYDEPAHWSTVRFYAETHRLPELGEPGTTYEAQMPPVYYTLAAPVVAARPADDAFAAVRIAGAAMVAVLVWLTVALGRALTGSGATGVLAGLLVAVNPLVAVVGGSVQNDLLATTVATGGALHAVRGLARPQWRPATFAIIGLVLGLAALVKASTVGVPAALLLAIAVAHRPWHQRAMAMAASALAWIATAGWWFARNVALYGDLTGAAGVRAAGYDFAPLPHNGIGAVVDWVRSLVSYAVAPTEYHRNVVHAPLAVAVLAAALALCAAVGLGGSLLLRRRDARRAGPTGMGVGRGSGSAYLLRREPAWVFAGAAVAATFLGYAVVAWTSQAIAPRVAMVAGPLGAVLLVAGLRVGRLRVGVVTTLAVGSVLALAWLLAVTRAVGYPWSP